MQIEIVSGSTRENSITFRVALHLQKQITERTDHHAGIIDVRQNNFPLLETVYTSVDAAPDQHKEVVGRMFAADAFIMVSPEYNGSYTACIKNFFDHFPKQHRKIFGIATASPGSLGGIRAAMQMQQYIYALFGIGSPYMLVTPQVDKKFDEEGNLIDPTFQKTIDLFIKEFIWLAESILQEKVST
ncbi:MAG TPA: NAD(P)H-dependent oxidoreductase [Flavisolibacter sp.]|nr:NAD(P)H-dependent oxidoreductase [Flavisolibacter sp.]